jgi:hypothetical protein
MTYVAQGLIQATDYNGFANNTVNANVNNVWGPGTGDSGYGQSTTLATVVATADVAAPSWSNLNNRITSLANQQNTTITTRTNPVAGDTITILNNLNTDLTNLNTNRGNAAASGTTSNSWSGTTSQTDSTGTGIDAWNLTWTHTVTFADANSARYFWNAGGLVRIDMNKTSTGTGGDVFWNSFIPLVGTLYISGRVNSTLQTIAGVTYNGTTRIGGTGGTETINGSIGWYSLSAGSAATQVFKLNSASSPYTDDYLSVSIAKDSTSTVLTITTVWHSAASTNSTQISGGTATISPFSSYGSAPTVLCRYVPPSTTYLTNTWGTPVVSASVAAT